MTSVHLAGVALIALLSENFILVNCMGIGTHTKAFEDPVQARRTGLALTLGMVLTTFLCWLADNLLLIPFGWTFLRTLTFTLLSLLSLFLLKHGLRLFIPELHRRLEEILPGVSSNCAVLGAALLVSQRGYSLGAAMLYALCGGVGATIVLMSYAGLREEVGFESCPKAFQGAPIALITAGLMALALVGFYGLQNA